MFKLKVEQEVPLKDVAYLISSGIDCGEYCSFTIIQYVKPSKLEFTLSGKDDDVCKYTDYPLNPGGAVVFQDKYGDEPTKYRLDFESIQKGLNIMAEKYPQHMANFLKENGDAITGDVFLQCCLLGDIVYG